MKWLIVLAYACTATSAHAQFYTGNKLHQECQKRTVFSLGYNTAVADWAITELRKGVCMPDQVTVGQVTDIICGYLTKHPENRHDPAHFLGAQALMEAFPCNN